MMGQTRARVDVILTGLGEGKPSSMSQRVSLMQMDHASIQQGSMTIKRSARDEVVGRRHHDHHVYETASQILASEQMTRAS